MTILQKLSGTTALAVFAYAAAAGGAQATPVGSTTSFTFSGDCDDCAGAFVPVFIPGVGTVSNVFHATGDGQFQRVTGTLVLSNFTPGVQMTSANFVSFHYDGSSILAPFTVTNETGFGATLDANGNLLGNLVLIWNDPAISFAVAPFDDFCGFGGEGSQCRFTVTTGGAWSIYAQAPVDIGVNGSFAVPEPLSIALLGSGLLGRGAAPAARRQRGGRTLSWLERLSTLTAHHAPATVHARRRPGDAKHSGAQRAAAARPCRRWSRP